MEFSNNELKQAFNLLDELAPFSPEELQAELTDHRMELLRQVSIMLLNINLDEIKTSKNSWYDVIQSLRETNRNWSRRMMSIIIESSDIAKKTGKDEAIKLLNNFIQNCSAPFFKNVAQGQIDTLERKYSK